MRTSWFKWIVFMMLIVGLTAPVSAQDMMMSPSAEVTDQVVVNGTVTVSKVYSEGPGFMVIHADNGSGSFGEVIGFRWVNPGENFNVVVSIDASKATSTLYAMLHLDTNEVGTYEFGTVDGADIPVVVDGTPVSPAFSASVLSVQDQFLDMNMFTAASVTVSEPSWLVIHAGDEANFGAVLGQTLLEPGTTTNVTVNLSADGLTEILWPMLHVDTGEAGVYEFGTVDGADGPIVAGGAVATAPVWTVPHVRASHQIVTHGDGMEMMGSEMEMMAPTLKIESVLAAEAGFLVVHQDVDGSFGPVAGLIEVPAGLSTNLEVELDPAMVTPRLWPMLHVDTGEAGVYEFGTVEGADGPVVDSAGNVVTFWVDGAPALQMTDGPLTDGSLVIKAALIDAPGWIAVHASNEGQPGEVIATYPLLRGLNTNIMIPLEGTAAGTELFPMLHYDTGEAGVYEFGTVEGADAPVFVGEAVIFGPLNVQ